MNRIVYLCELDSVRDKDVDKKSGVLNTDAFKALRREIVKNGNSVAVTMNQLTDSSFFAQVFNDEYAYECVLRLFELGALRVSIFRDKENQIRTASQYVQNALTGFRGDGSRFVFSNFPIKGEDSEEFKQTVLNALRYSDLSELKEISEKVGDTDREYASRIKTLIRFVNVILKISVCETANLPPKSADEDCGIQESTENAEQIHAFVRFMDGILRALRGMSEDAECAELYEAYGAEIERAVAELSNRMRELQGNEGVYKRSTWLFEKNTKLFSGLSEEIIHICYNYTVEDSIIGVCEHFESKNIKSDLYLKIFDYFNRQKSASIIAPKRVKKRSWRTILRFAEYREKQEIEYDGIYADVFARDRLRWKGFIIKKSLGAFFWAFIYICLFCAAEIINKFLEDTFSLSMPNQFLTVLMNVLVFGILGSLIGVIFKKTNKNHDVPDILESVVDIGIHICDLIIVIIGEKNGSKKLS